MHSNLSLPLLCRLDGFACSIYEAQTERMPSQAYRFPWLCSSEMRDMREPINQTASSEEKSWLLGLSWRAPDPMGLGWLEHVHPVGSCAGVPTPECLPLELPLFAAVGPHPQKPVQKAPGAMA